MSIRKPVFIVRPPVKPSVFQQEPCRSSKGRWNQRFGKEFWRKRDETPPLQANHESKNAQHAKKRTGVVERIRGTIYTYGTK
jgi:hypothetical protein